MIHRARRIGRWTAVFLFATKRYDIEGVLACLYDFGASRKVMREAEDFMLQGRFNQGFTFSNPKEHCAVVLIGPTTSGAEFLNTLAHEIDHLSAQIAYNRGKSLRGEAPAYIAGDSTRALAEIICELGCDHCRPEKV